MGLRERKKEETRRTLLRKAGELFAGKGYRNVTTAQIAHAAGVAEGTLFNYYRSKSELFMAVILTSASDEAPSLTENAVAEPTPDKQLDGVLPAIDPQRLAAALAARIDQELSGLARLDKRTLQDYFTVVFGGELTEAVSARTALMSADEETMRRTAAYLERQRDAYPEQLAGLRTELAVRCLYGCAVSLLIQYILLDDWSYDRLRQAIYDQFVFILTGHVGVSQATAVREPARGGTGNG